MNPPPTTYGCVVVAQLAAQAALRLRPHLAQIPLVILRGQRPHERVCSLNRQAQAAGLHLNMTRIEVETFPEVALLPQSQAEERAAHAILVESLGNFTPRLEPYSADPTNHPDWECILDLTGNERLLGDAPILASRIVTNLQQLGFVSAVVMAANADAGLSAARMLAWSCSPKNTQVILPAQTAKALATLPLSVLRLDPETSERLEIWGIATLGELAALPEMALIARMGQPGRLLRQRALGILQHLLKPVAEAFGLHETLELEDAVETLEPLLFLLNPMLEQLILRAQQRALALAAVTLELTLRFPADRDLSTPSTLTKSEEDETFTRTIRPAVPLLNRPLLLKMLQLDLEAHPAPGAIIRITLSAEPGDTSRIQMGLFAPQMPEPTRFEDTHARLVSLVGEGNVGRVKPLDTHNPESFRLERFSLPQQGSKIAPSKAEAARPATALRRQRPPIPVRVHLRERKIVGLWYEARRFDVLRCYGPWRASGDWWNGHLWSADTWDLAAHDALAGELMFCLLAHNLVQNTWALAGIYD